MNVPTADQKRVVVVGATGMVGGYALRYALEHPCVKFAGPLETANGMLLFGVSTAMIFAVMLWLIQARFTDLKS